jgi:hypothetical protein
MQKILNTVMSVVVKAGNIIGSQGLKFITSSSSYLKGWRVSMVTYCIIVKCTG